MDAFFASVEQRDFPELKGKPVAVGGNRERGVVAAASYEARKFGVKSAMSSKIAYQRCPDIIFQKPRFEVYKEVSGQIRQIFEQYTDLIEPLSLDEAYLDVTSNKKGIASATEIAEAIRAEIFKQTELTASAGVSVNKFVAKLASDENKPNGICVIPPKKVDSFIKQLPVKRFHGVGKVTAAKMQKMGVLFGSDLLKMSKDELQRYFGKSGGHYYNIARGIDERPVNPNRIRKSLGAESTFEHDIQTLDEVQEKITLITDRVWSRIEKAKVTGRTITLKVKYADFQSITRSLTLEAGTFTNKKEILEKAIHLSNSLDLKQGIRLLGVSLSNFPSSSESKKKVSQQLTLDF